MAYFYDTRPELLALHRRDPLSWYVQRWGGPASDFEWSGLPAYQSKKVWDGDRDPLMRMWNAIAAGRNTGVESATSTGKTYAAAIILLWFLDVYRGGQVVMVGPSETHLKRNLWVEVKKHRPRFKRMYPNAVFGESCSLKVDPSAEDVPKWTAWAKTAKAEAGAESSTGMQGTHAQYMLHIIDEGAGADEAQVEAIINTSTGDFNPILMVGNPNNANDPLHKFCVRASTVHVRISALDHPNVVVGQEIMPGAVTRRSIDDRRGKDGANVNTNLFKSRIQGLCPDVGALSMFRPEWFDAALERGLDPVAVGLAEADGFPAMGIDAARSEGGDKAAQAFGRGGHLVSLRAFQCPNASDIAYNVVYGPEWCKERGKHVYGLVSMYQELVWPDMIGVDVTGVGTSTVEAFLECGQEVRSLAGSASQVVDNIPSTYSPTANKTTLVAEYANLRAQMIYQFADDLRLNLLAFHPSTKTLVEAAKKHACVLEEKAVGTKKGVTGKKDIMKQFGESPNELDALVYWNFVRKDRRVYLGPGVSV